MAVVTLYFGPSVSGTGDGTTWGDRAQLLPSGAWNTLISGHNWNGPDSLRCVIETGTYSVPALTFSTGAPTINNRFSLHAGTSSGLWQPPSSTWNCCQPMWDNTGMVTLTTTATNIVTSRHADIYGMRLLQTGSNNITVQNLSANWCEFNSSSSGGSSYAAYGNELTNCVLRHTATTYSALAYVDSPYTVNNVRFEGSNTGTGTRGGIFFGTNVRFSNLCFIKCAVGITPGSLTTTFAGTSRCTFVDCTTGILDRATTSTLNATYLRNLFHNCTTGISLTDATKCRPVIDNVFNSCGTNVSNSGNWDVANLNALTSLAASDLFVDPTNGDYRIKYGSAHWGKGVGAGDGPIPPSVIAQAIWEREGRSLT
jgi:hypothetical protein